MNNDNWNKMYKLAKQYYDKNGNLLIPQKFVTADGIKLGYWIGTQRRNYKQNKLSKNKIDLLTKIDMIL